MNSANATVCIWCHGPFPERKAGALVPAWPVAEVLRFLPRPSSRVIAVAALVAAIGALGYYGYRQTALVDGPRPEAAGSEAAAGAKSAGDTNRESASPLAAPARAAANPAPAGRLTVESQKGKAAAAAITRSQTIDAGKPSEPGPSRREACTEALAALGLCAAKPEAGKAGGQEASRDPACTGAAAALGLCTPGTTQRRE